MECVFLICTDACVGRVEPTAAGRQIGAAECLLDEHQVLLPALSSSQPLFHESSCCHMHETFNTTEL